MSRAGDILLGAGVVDAEGLAAAQETAARRQEPLVHALVRDGHAPSRQVAEALYRGLQVRAVDLDVVPVDRHMVELLPLPVMRRLRSLPFGTDRSLDPPALWLAMSDPSDQRAFDAVRGHLGSNADGGVVRYLAEDAALERAFTRLQALTRHDQPETAPPAEEPLPVVRGVETGAEPDFLTESTHEVLELYRPFMAGPRTATEEGPHLDAPTLVELPATLVVCVVAASSTVRRALWGALKGSRATVHVLPDVDTAAELLEHVEVDVLVLVDPAGPGEVARLRGAAPACPRLLLFGGPADHPSADERVPLPDDLELLGRQLLLAIATPSA